MDFDHKRSASRAAICNLESAVSPCVKSLEMCHIFILFHQTLVAKENAYTQIYTKHTNIQIYIYEHTNI